MPLDLTPLSKALTSFEGAIGAATNSVFMDSLNDIQRRTFRAGVIQNFEFCYEISWKMLRRQLIEDEGESEIITLSRKDLFRLAAQKTLIDNPEQWFVFHRARNETSHTYDEAKAQEVFEIAVRFLAASQSLHKKLVSK